MDTQVARVIDLDLFPEKRKLSDEQIAQILKRPEGAYWILNYCRDGLIDPQKAVEAIEASRDRSSWGLLRGLFRLFF